MWAALGALLSHWRRHPGQFVTLVLGLALATALWSTVQAINAEARASYDAAAGSLGLSGYDRIVGPEGEVSLEAYVALRRAGWRVSPVLEGRWQPGGGGPALTLVGLDVLSAPPGAWPAANADPVDVLTGQGVLYAAPELAARLEGLDTGRLVRVSAGVPPGQVVTDVGTAEVLLERQGRLSHVVVLPEQPRGISDFRDVAPGLAREAAADPGEIARLTRSFHLNLTAFGLLSFGVGLFIVHGTIGLAFEQRRGMIRTLRAVGVSGRTLVGLLLGEVVLLALVAGALGLALGYAIAAALLPDVAATLRGLYGATVQGSLRFDPGWALAGMAMALAGALVAAVEGVVRVLRMPLLASARPRAWATVSGRALRGQALAGAVLLVAGALAPLVADGLIAGFALLAGLLLGAALMLPLGLSAVLRAGVGWAQQPLAHWFWADTRQQLPGLSLALMALLLALSANIGVGTMVGSFRLTFTGWLDQRLAADLYVSTSDAREAAAVAEFAEAEGLGLLPRASVDRRLGGAPGSLEGIVDHPVYRENWPLLARTDTTWDAVAAGDGVLINEQLALRSGLRLGARLELAPGWALPVAGIYSDYGNPAGQAMVALEALVDRFPAAAPRSFGLVAGDAGAKEGLRARLSAATGVETGAMIDQAEVKAISLAVFERTFAVTAALNVLTLGVAGVAILTALATLSGMRLPQVAPVWALGITRARLARLDLLRSALLAALTFALALPVGLAVAWALLAVVNVEAFGWRLPMHLFPRDWVLLFALALVAALVAAALPARRLRRTAPAQFLKVFANER
ncbi:MAG: FtsX-like permease family protein [Pseudomonadota bacterium]